MPVFSTTDSAWRYAAWYLDQRRLWLTEFEAIQLDQFLPATTVSPLFRHWLFRLVVRVATAEAAATDIAWRAWRTGVLPTTPDEHDWTPPWFTCDTAARLPAGVVLS